MQRRSIRHIATLLVLLAAHTCLAERNVEDEDSSPDDRKVGKTHELKIFTDDQRMSLVSGSEIAQPVTLSVFFRLTSPFEILELNLPPGFAIIADDKYGCGMHSKPQGDNTNPWAKGSSPEIKNLTKASREFGEWSKARHLVDHMKKCHIYEKKPGGLHPTQEDLVHVRMSLEEDIPYLSKPMKTPLDNSDNPRAEVWWYFALHIKNPDNNPLDKDNFFNLFHYHSKGQWNGHLLQRGYSILGNWPCKYSEWEGWGQCSARCGGGVNRLRRVLVSEPPPHRGKFFADECSEPLEKILPCNTYSCKFPCELVDVQEPGICSAECGGGVKTVRWRWRGENCPAKDDYEAVRFEPCNTEPCRVRCKLADTWTVVTECSEVCGQGTYRMMREVVQKDKDDPSCQPEWREVKCAKQWCTQLTVIRPDRNILPYPGDRYYVGIAFKLTFSVQKVTLSAPAGYSFGTAGSDCFIHDHDLFPVYKGCKVGIHGVDGRWSDDRSITILLGGLLTRSESGRYHFMIAVNNAACPKSGYESIVTVDEVQGPKEVCKIPYDENMWELQLTKEIADGVHSRILSVWSSGYELHNPQDSRKSDTSGGKELFWDTTNEAQFISLEDTSWRTKVIYCSPRLEPCPNGVPCPPNGLCPTPDDSQDDTMMTDGTWTLDDAQKVFNSDIAPGDSASELDEKEGVDE